MQFIFSISGLINFIATISIALFVLLNNRRPFINKIFLLLILSNSIWSFGYWRWLTIYDNPTEAIFWIRILSIGSVLTSLFCLHWILLLLDTNNKKLLWAYYLLTVVYSFFFFSDKFVSGVRQIMWFSYWATPGPIYNLYLITHYLVLLPSLVVVILKANKKFNGFRKMQLYYVAFGSMLGFFAAGTNFFLWYGIKIPPFGNFFVFLYPTIFAYAMFKYRLMDVKLILRKYSVYLSALLTTVLFSGVLAIFYVAFNINLYRFGVIILILSVIVFPSIKKYYYRLANKYFFSSLYDSQKIIGDLSDRLRSALDINRVYADIHEILIDSFHLKSIGILSYNEKIGNYTFLYSFGLNIGKQKTLPISRELRESFIEQNKSIIVEEIRRDYYEKYKATIDLLSFTDVEILTPLKSKNKVIGLLALGKKESGDMFNEEDLRVLKIVSGQAAVAIENARLHQEVEEFNHTLQQKVDKQTKELKKRAEHLEKLMEMRSEFLDITSHQLRTPISVIKGVLSMLQEGSVPKNMQKEFLNNALEKSIKLGEIINDILRASEMDTDKFTMSVAPVDLNEIIDKIKNDKLKTALVREVELKFALAEKPLPPVMTNNKYIEQAIVNLINNAFQYTPKGSITVSTEVKPSAVVVRVSDTGIGIPEKDRNKLFQKFGRAENAVQAYTDGSGLGLFIIKQIVDATPGAKIEIEKTELGKGTTFALSLPIASTEIKQPAKQQ